MIPLTAVIPTRFDITRLLDLIPNIVDDVHDIYILDNGLKENDKNKLLGLPKVRLLPCEGKSIYQMWNFGMDITVKHHGIDSYTAILNDDIVLLPKTLAILAGFLDYYKDLVAVSPDYNRKVEEGIGTLRLQYVTSTFGHNGLGGMGFVLSNKFGIRIDEAFGWWYGDDDLVKQILALEKKLGKVLGLPLDHFQGTSYNYIAQELEAQIKLDMEYFNKKYKENRTRW